MSDTPGWGSDLETGLRDDFDAAIVNSYFGTDARYNNGETMLLKWEITGLDNEGIAFEDTLLITVGKGWESTDGGQTIRHESGNPKKFFNANSHYGAILDRTIKGLQIGNVLEGRGTPFQASVWTGLNFHFKRESKDYTIDGEAKVSNKVMPTAFNGEGAVPAAAPAAAAAPATAPTPAPAAATPAAAPTAPAADPSEVGVRALLKAAAITSATHAEFVDKALAIDGVVTNEGLMSEIVNEADFFAKAKA